MKRKGLNLPKQRTFIGPAIIWKRIAAFILDMFVIEFVLAFPFQSVIKSIIPGGISYAEAYQFFAGNPQFTAMLSTLMFIVSILALFYFSVCEYKLGRTVGKIFMNITVTSENKKLSYWQCLGRSLFLLPVFPFFLLWFIDPLFLFFNKKGQRLSEVLTKTRVVEDYVIG
jgi:hypothetical protein